MKASPASHYIRITLLTIALCALYSLMDGLGTTLVGLCISSCLALAFYNEHYGKAIANSLLVVIIFFLQQGVVSALMTSVPILLVALSLNLGARLRLPLFRVVLICFVLYVSDIVINLKLISYVTDGEMTISSLMLQLGEEIRALPQLQSADPAVKNVVEQVIRTSVDASIRFAPAVFMIISMALAYGVVALFKAMQVKRGVTMDFWVPFTALHAHWILGAQYLLFGILLFSAPQGYFFDLTANVLLVMSFIFVVLGVSVILFKSQLNPGGNGNGKWIILLVLCVIGMVLLPILVCLFYGLTDSFFDYRKAVQQKREQ